MEAASLSWGFVLHFVKGLHNEFPAGLLGFLCMTGTSLLLLRQGHHYMQLHKTKARIRKRQAKAADNIDTIRQRLETCSEATYLTITHLQFSDLQFKLKEGELTCMQVLRAYQAKALEVHEATNCVTGFILNAEELASQLDSLMPEQRGPLHGIPVSLKEVVGVKGDDCTAGLSVFIDQIYDDYGVIIKVLMKNGAIPFVRTNIPQLQLSYDCSNPIYGETRNPLNLARSCGGSSGGEAALLAGGGSILGIGCDAGGSLRIPPHFCGVLALKPTTERLSHHGNIPIGEGIGLIREAFGPMARDTEALTSCFKATLDPEMYRLDPLVPKVPWNDELYTSQKSLKIGFYIHDGGLLPVPAVERAVLLAKKTLEAKGHKVEAFQPPDDVMKEVFDIALAPLYSDGGQLIVPYLKHDVTESFLKPTLLLGRLPYLVRRLLSKLLKSLHPVEKTIFSVKPCRNVYEWWKKTEQAEAFKRKFLSHMQSQGLDAILCPAFPMPAFQLGNSGQSTVGSSYPALYNVLDFPTGSMPVTLVTRKDVKKMESYPKKHAVETYVHNVCKGSEGLPIAVQCASFPFKEEVVLRMMKDLETGLSNAGHSPRPRIQSSG